MDNLFGGQLDNYSRALGRASERQGLLANNLANANVPGYKRKDMDFSIALNQATTGLTTGPGSLPDLSGKEGVQTNSGEVRIDGNSVDIEQEAMAITETEYRYQMLSDMTSDYFSNLKNIITGAK